MLSFVRISLALAMGLALVLPSMAADDAPAATKATRSTTNATAQTDSQLAGCLVIDNEGEVAIAQFAKEKSQNKEVQEFAQMLIDDHGKFLDKLVKFNPVGARRAAVRDAAPAAGGLRPAAASGLDFLALKREIADECQATLENEFGKKEGREFDQCFLFQQAMAHTHMLDMLTVFQKHATPEFASVLEDASKTTAHHLAEAKELAKKFEGTPKTARR